VGKLLAELMAGGADDGCLVLLVAVDAGFHGVVDFLGQHGAFVHGAMAAGAIDFRVDMGGVAEKDVVGEAVDALRGELRVIGEAGVTGAAGGGLGEAGAFGFGGAGVAEGAVQLEGGMNFVAERGGGAGGPGGQGSDEETKASELMSYLLPPPAAMTTNCFFVLFPI